MNDATTPIGEGKVTVGGRLSKCSSPSFASQAQSKIRAHDRRIEHLAQERYPETTLLRQVPGVGALTALAAASAGSAWLWWRWPAS